MVMFRALGQAHRLPRILRFTCLGIVAAVATALTLVVLFQRYQTIRHAQSQFTQLTAVVAEQAEHALESVDLLLETAAIRLSRSAPGDAAAYASIQSYLSRQAEGMAQLSSVLVLDADGKLIIDSESAVPRVYNGSSGESFRYYRNGGTERVHISAPVKSRLTGRWLIAMSSRVNGPNGSFGGIVVASVDLTYFADFYGAIGLGAGGSAYWLRTDGVLLLRHPFEDSFLGRVEPDDHVRQAFERRELSGIVREFSPFDGVDRFLAYRALRAHPILVIVGNSVEAVLAPWVRFAFTLAIIGLIAIMLLAAGSALLVKLARREDILLGEAEEARAEAELASKAAERASRAKSEFLAGVSHDLRTPLNSIIGFSEVLLSDSKLTDKQREYIQYVSTAGTHLLSLINNLLDLAKIEANRLTILDDKFALHGVINECMRLVGAQAGAGRVTLVPYENRQFGLRADPVRLRQIVFNLLSNAIKFTPPGGTVEVRSILREDGSLAISVMDTGIGMSAEDIKTAMQPYGQVQNSLVRSHEGTGLGLPLVHALTELHGGKLEISSVPRKGTTMTIILPGDRVLLIDQDTRAA
jgi:two-component system, cell cycle sensor histidine kinase PleC